MPASTRSNGTFSSSSAHNTFCTLMELARPQTLSIVTSQAPCASPVQQLGPPPNSATRWQCRKRNGSCSTWQAVAGEEAMRRAWPLRLALSSSFRAPGAQKKEPARPTLGSRLRLHLRELGARHESVEGEPCEVAQGYERSKIDDGNRECPHV